ncbi:MAG: hypothetical protein QOF90_2265 [Acetobacteraceae bacterium]|nr:hypothetical protein [Acetobacteraceae bacterium]
MIQSVFSAFCWALALIITRKIALSDAPRTTVLWSAAIDTAVLTAVLSIETVWPDPKQLGPSLTLGMLASGPRQVAAEVAKPLAVV